MSQDYVIPLPPPPSLPVAGSASRFPVRRILCVARNYAAHAREMGSDPNVETPFFFAKPPTAILSAAPGEEIAFPYPPQSQEVHHELELVLALGSGGYGLSPEQAAHAVWGYAIGLDMTCRDLQAQAKAKGRPWEIGKAFDHSAPISPIHPAEGAILRNGRVSLEVNGERRQDGDLADMIYDIPSLVAFFSRQTRLEAGDLIFTGTPEGVGPVQVGDLLRGSVEGVGELQVRVVAPAP